MLEGMATFHEQLAKHQGVVRGSLFAVLASECIPHSSRLTKEIRAAVYQIELILERGFRREHVHDPKSAAVCALIILEGAFLLKRIKGSETDLQRLIKTSTAFSESK